MPDPQIQNLRDLANSHSGAKTAGSKLGHDGLKFRDVDAAESSFVFDQWTNITDNSTNPSKADLRGAVAWADQDADSIRTWDRNISGVEFLARRLFFDNRLPADWCDRQDGAWTTLPLRNGVALANAPERWLFKLLVSGAAIAYWREKSGIRLNITNVNLLKAKPNTVAKRKLTVPDDFDVEHLEFNWLRLVRSMRTLVRSWIIQGYPAPGSYSEASQQLDNEIVTLLEEVAGFKQLRQAGYLVPEPHGNAYQTQASARLFLGSTFETDRTGDLVIAFNHARFVMWMDWRIATEVCLRRGGGIF